MPDIAAKSTVPNVLLTKECSRPLPIESHRDRKQGLKDIALAALSESLSATLLATQPYEYATGSSSHSHDIPPGAALNRASVDQQPRVLRAERLKTASDTLHPARQYAVPDGDEVTLCRGLPSAGLFGQCQHIFFLYATTALCMTNDYA